MKGHSDHHKEVVILNNREEIEELARSHPKFRAFANEIDSCLQLFERSKEWSDYVSALSKLIKVCHSACIARRSSLVFQFVLAVLRFG